MSTPENFSATFVSALEPVVLWKHFDQILAIPRGSKNEEGMRQYVLAAAATHGLAATTDAAGNVVVRVPPSPGREGAAPLALQSHLDMVCEKNSDVTFDFAVDAIRPRRDGDYLYATGTTLGADNGIGVAAMLAVMESRDLVHGALELLFTIDEETGLTGAADLDPRSLSAKRLLNLDTEEEYALYVGCAGGAGTDLAIPLETMFGAEGLTALALRLGGLKGGHSGVDIHLQRGNAIALLARALHALWREFQFEVARIEGGNMHNAIPREATALVRVTSSDAARFKGALEAQIAAMALELAGVEEGVRVEVAPALANEVPAQVWSDATTLRVLSLLVALPHGVLAMSHDLPGLVETSTNLSKVRTDGTALRIHQSNRSSVMSALRATQQRIAAFAELAGGEAVQSEGYPGWKPDMGSAMLATLKEVHAATFGRAPEIKAIHAGLECGLIGEKFPGMDMSSFGPQIEFPHSPDERVLVPSVGRFWQLLTAALQVLSV
ncbi:MAG: aminoacyl-histidine dipeptidase [Thermoanaerobaculia bacterium]